MTKVDLFLEDMIKKDPSPKRESIMSYAKKDYFSAKSMPNWKSVLRAHLKTGGYTDIIKNLDGGKYD